MSVRRVWEPENPEGIPLGTVSLLDGDTTYSTCSESKVTISRHLFVQTANGVGDAQQNTTVKCHHFRHAEYVLQAEGGKCLIGKGILF